MNKNQKVIEDFGDELADFTYETKTIHLAELENNFLQYFSIFTWKNILNDAEGFDMGCGSGRWAQFVELFGFNVSNFLLSDYRNKPFYQIRNDALDRFGTRLEQRFSRQQIEDMLLESGFEDISFSEEMPFWTSISYKS